MKKKIIAVVLSVIVACTIIPTLSFADDGGYQKDITGKGFDFWMNTSILYDGYEGWTYNGKERNLKSNIHCIFNGDEMVEGTDYEIVVTPETVIDIGEYKLTATITGIGNYTGIVTKTNTIRIAPQKVTLSSVKAQKKAVTLKWKTVAGNITGYKIFVLKPFAKGSVVKTVWVKSATAKSKTIKGLKSKKKYYFVIQAYTLSNGTKVYGNERVSKIVKTK